MSKGFTMEEKAGKGTVVRTIALVITWANMLLANYDLQPIPLISDELIADILAGIATIYGWFYNNYITATGKKQKKVLKERRLTKAK